jgi:hypothetical protein
VFTAVNLLLVEEVEKVEEKDASAEDNNIITQSTEDEDTVNQSDHEDRENRDVEDNSSNNSINNKHIAL